MDDEEFLKLDFPRFCLRRSTRCAPRDFATVSNRANCPALTPGNCPAVTPLIMRGVWLAPPYVVSPHHFSSPENSKNSNFLRKIRKRRRTRTATELSVVMEPGKLMSCIYRKLCHAFSMTKYSRGGNWTVRPVYWVTVMLTVLCSTVQCNQALTSYGMSTVFLDGSGDNKCGGSSMERIVQDWSGFIYSHQPISEHYAGGKNCFLILKAPDGYRIRLSVLDFHLVGTSKKRDCPGDSLQIFDHIKSEKKPGEMVEGPGPIIGMYCGVQQNGTILAESTLNELTLWWHTDPELKKIHDGKGFRLLWTIYRSGVVTSCNKVSEFQCRNGDCIPSKLACDRISHCVDSSDLELKLQKEIGCTNLPDPTILGSLGAAALAGICIGCVLGMVLICVVLSVCCREKCRKGRHMHYSPDGAADQVTFGCSANGCAPTDHLTCGPTDHVMCAGGKCDNSPKRAQVHGGAQQQRHLYGNAGNCNRNKNGINVNNGQNRQLMKQAPYNHGPGRGHNIDPRYCTLDAARTFNV